MPGRPLHTRRLMNAFHCLEEREVIVMNTLPRGRKVHLLADSPAVLEADRVQLQEYGLKGLVQVTGEQLVQELTHDFLVFSTLDRI